jgi:hypothetical protein
MTMYEKLEAYLGFPPDIIKKVILVESKGVETIEKWYYTEKPKPTQEELDAVELTYVQKRLKEYPSIQEQLDMQYWDKLNGTTNWEDAISKVKLDNPKS